MIRVEHIFISPVKSLRLARLEHAYLDKPGISGDRAFFLIDADSKLYRQKESGRLVQLIPEYDPASGALRINFPDGSELEGVPELGEPITILNHGRDLAGRLVDGDWSSALSDFAGAEIRLVKADTEGTAFDAFPISMCSSGSLDALAQAAGEAEVDGRRFRQNIYIEGAAAHEEDTWIDGEVRVGEALLRVKMVDPRCVVTTYSPDTGEPDLNTLKLIASYRSDQPKQVNFGVYCTVAEPGEVAVGDEVAPV